MIGLPACFEVVIQDTASTATLAALLTAREKTTCYRSNRGGLRDKKVFRVLLGRNTFIDRESRKNSQESIKITAQEIINITPE